MAFMFELYCQSPVDEGREARIISEVIAAGGRLDFREPADKEGGPVCLTFEFANHDVAETVATRFRKQGEHVEGVCDYG